MEHAAEGDSSESAAAKEPPQPQQQEEQEVVAVGAVAHVIRRAFHEFYKDARSSRSQQSTPRPTDEDNAAATDSADAAPIASSTDLTTAEGGEAYEDLDTVAVEPLYVSPAIATGLARKQQLEEELQLNHANANSLLEFLAKRHTEAQNTDELIDAELRRKGLVIKAQIPMGPSNLRLEQHELVEAFGDATAALLVHAKQLVSEFHQRRLDKSGNGVNSEWRRAALKAEALGYLDSTSSYDTRKEAILAAHQTHIENVREHTMKTKMRHAESNHIGKSTDQSSGNSGDINASSDPIDSSISSSSSPSPLPSANKAKTQTMNAVEKRKNMEILRRMNTKLDFLRNPRYVKDSVRFSDHGDGEDETNEDENEQQDKSKRLIQSAGFVSVPSPVEFIEYDTDGIYEQVVFIRNTSALSRRMRVLPPSTLHFSIHEVVFPDSSGLIAPGMHVEIRLRFAPDSRSDYRDSIAIQYEGAGAQSEQFLVPLYAHRRPPELSIPLVLHAQNTLVGGESLTKIICKNTGGPGRFWLLSEQEYTRMELSSGGVLRATSNLDLMRGNQADQLSVGPFCMTPNELDLNTGESVELQLHYIPSCIGEQREKIVMVCDNCLVRVFQLVGRGCQIEMNITAINGKPIDTGITKMGTVEEVYFDPLLIDASSTKSLVVFNGTPINLNFSWQIEPINDLQVSRTESAPPYQISPSSGTFQLSSSREFQVTFAPHYPNIYTWRAIFCINNVPACCMPGPEQVHQLMTVFQAIKAGTTSFRETLLEQVPCKSLKLIGAGRLGMFTISPSFIRLTSSLTSSSSDGPLLKHASYTANVMLMNDTGAVLNIEWDLGRVIQRHMPKISQQPMLNNADAFDLCIQPKRIQLAPNDQINVAVTFTPHCVGPFSIAIPCQIPVERKHEPNTPADSFERWLLLEGVVASGEIQIIDPEVDFGLVLVGTGAEQKLILRNNSTAEAQWRLVHLEATDNSYGSANPKESEIIHHPASNSRRYTDPPQRKTSRDLFVPPSRHLSIPSVTSNGIDSARSSSMSTFRDTAPRAIVAFAPENGQLAAGETQIIAVRCLAGVLPERFRAQFCCHQAPERLFSGEQQLKSVMVSARAEIQCPNVYLMPMKLHLGTTYKDVTVSRKLELINLSNLETSFKFAEPQGSSKMYSVEFLPKQGVLRSKETLSIVMQYTPRQAGKNTVLFACMVRGLPAPLGFEVTTNQKGLVLSYELLSTGADGKPIAIPKSPKEIALERGMTISDCDLEPETNPLSNFPKLQFGDAISLASRATVFVLIRNFSGIEAIIDLEAKRFPAIPSLPGLMSPHQTLHGSDTASSLNSSNQLNASPTSTSSRQRALGHTKRSQKQSTTSSSTKKKKLLSNSHEHASRFQSEKGKEYVERCDEDEEAQHVLSQGHGVVFQARPNHFRIPPWEQIVAAITCFNNMPGTYNDDIVSRAMGMPPVFLHASANVVGTPLFVDRNCVGLYFGKHGNKKPQLISIAGKQQQKPVQPTLHFGQLCQRSPKVTRTIRIINRGPKAARLKWKLVEKDRENQLVNVTLRIDSSAGVQLQILPCAEDDTAFPFEIDPPLAVIAPFATVPFHITYQPPQHCASPRILLLADAKWYDVNGPKCDGLSDSNSQASIGSNASDPLLQDLRCEESPPASKSRSPQVANTAVGKAFTAVRMVNLIARRQPSISFDSPPTSVTPKCLRVLLAADVIEPELFLDQSPGGILPPAERGRYHVHFKTWSTIAEKPSELMHSFHRKQLFLVNHMNTRLTFRFDSTGPFSVFQADSLAPKHPLSLADLPPAHRRAQGESYMFALPPQMSVRLDVRFDPSAAPSNTDQSSSSSNFMRRRSLPAGGSSASTLTSTSSSSLSCSQNNRNALKRPTINGELLVRFANHAVQTIRLAAEIIRPILLVSPSVYFFGHVHLSKTRSVVLRLANASEVPASFKIQHVPRPTPMSRAQKQEVKRHRSHFVDEPGVFTFATLQGVVEGPTLSLRSSGGYSPSTNSTQDLGGHPIVKNAVEIAVTFRAPVIKKRYQSRFRFVVEHGNDFEIVLEGEGHLNEQEVLDQDRSLVRTRTLTHSNRMFTRGLR